MVNIYLYRSIKPKEVILSMKKHLGLNYSESNLENSGGRALSFDDGKFVIYTMNKSIKTLAHECLHITNMILERAAVKVDLDNDEAQAYLLGWLMEKCEK